MNRILCAGVALALSTGVALASDQFANMYGNTLHVKNSKGEETAIFINADGTWTQSMGEGKAAAGTYAWKDPTHFCITVTDPAPKPGEQAVQECHEVSGDHKVGDTWTMTDEDGTATLTITAGR